MKVIYNEASDAFTEKIKKYKPSAVNTNQVIKYFILKYRVKLLQNNNHEKSEDYQS